MDSHIDIQIDDRPSPYFVHTDALKNLARLLLHALHLQNTELSVRFVSDAQMQAAFLQAGAHISPLPDFFF